MPSHRILFCASEAYPLIKTGGLADVAGSLPRALQHLGHDVRLVLPAYQSVMQSLKGQPQLRYQTRVGEYSVSLLQTTLPGSRVPVWLIDCPALFDRPGNPYHDETGLPWADNAQRFALFDRVVVRLANNQFGMDWQPQLVHCHDWQTGLVPALLSLQPQRPATVFTIHNLAYQGLFDRSVFERLQLPESLWSFDQLEYHGGFSFIKGGLVFADRINTVSPSYAQEIQTPAFGHGMQGLLQHRAARLSGIINGIDEQTWNPGTDPLIAQKYNRQQLNKRLANKRALQAFFKLPQDDVLLLGLVSRLAEQKGIDMLINLLPALMKKGLQLVVVGSGDKVYERILKQASQSYADRMGVYLGYSEQLAHQVEAGADAFLMPSRFEPCGLNQMYSQRYGCLPIVTPLGGLRDTVLGVNETTLAQNSATGFVMSSVSEAGLLRSIEQAARLYRDKPAWQRLQRAAMQRDFSWTNSAQEYGVLYAQALQDHPAP